MEEAMQDGIVFSLYLLAGALTMWALYVRIIQQRHAAHERRISDLRQKILVILGSEGGWWTERQILERSSEKNFSEVIGQLQALVSEELVQRRLQEPHEQMIPDIAFDVHRITRKGRISAGLGAEVVPFRTRAA